MLQKHTTKILMLQKYITKIYDYKNLIEIYTESNYKDEKYFFIRQHIALYVDLINQPSSIK